MTRLYLIRHGETVYNREGRYQGRMDVELSTLGKEQAQALAHRLAETPFTAIYASNLKRAQETAEIIAAHHNLPVQEEPDLRERDFGAWEGFTFAEIEERYPEEAKRWLKDPLRTKIPGAEDFAHLQRRVTKAIEKIQTSHSGKEVAIVTHGGCILAFLAHVLELGDDAMLRIRVDNASVNIVDYYGQTPVLSLLNDTCHQDQPEFAYFRWK
ncbi:MAG: alpha-ribazole phosphatase [Firmicutes bacterium]|jgi:alpha-ribazole phosphatase|nr:alpha-ribazole phosphatase [Bacillota bacterium]